MTVKIAKLENAQVLRELVLFQRAEVVRGNISEYDISVIEQSYRTLLENDVYETVIADITPREVRARAAELDEADNARE